MLFFFMREMREIVISFQRTSVAKLSKHALQLCVIAVSKFLYNLATVSLKDFFSSPYLSPLLPQAAASPTPTLC